MRLQNKFSSFTWSVLAFIAAHQAYAAPQPDAGSLLQQIDRDNKPQLPRKALPERPAVPEAMQPQSGALITVKSFRFAGNTLLGSDKLAPVVAGFLNRPLDFAELQKAAAAVANTYRDAGWIVRAYLPAQDIQDGIVTIQIVEAVFGGVQLEGQPPLHIKLDTVLSIFDARQKKGALLNADALDRALLLADDLPGVAVSGSLREGEHEKETELVLKLADEPLSAIDASLDNTGSRSTGEYRLNASLNLNSPLKLGDLTSANVIHTQGSDYLRLGETIPLGAEGWRVGLNGSYLNYRLVAPEFVALNASGTSATLGLEASYPIIRSRLKNLYFSASFDQKSFDNRASGATATLYKSYALTLGLSGNLFDNLGGGGANSANVALVTGRLNLDGSPNQAADAATTQTDGHYSKLRYAFTRQQAITEDISLFAALSGQNAGKNLDSSEKFYLGGSGGVRAYPSNEGGGASGDLINLELRSKLPHGYSLTGFYDYGQITINPDNNFAGASALNGYSLEGIGLALGWQPEKGPTFKATWARRIGNNPNPLTTATNFGNDQDGSLHKNRFWLTASQSF